MPPTLGISQFRSLGPSKKEKKQAEEEETDDRHIKKEMEKRERESNVEA